MVSAEDLYDPKTDIDSMSIEFLEQTEKEMSQVYNITRQAVAKRIKNVLSILSTYANN